MAKDGTARGGARAGSGRKSKALAEKIGTDNPGGRKLTVMELPTDADLSGEDMPEVKSYMKERQKNGEDFDAADIFERLVELDMSGRIGGGTQFPLDDLPLEIDDDHVVGGHFIVADA